MNAHKLIAIERPLHVAQHPAHEMRMAVQMHPHEIALGFEPAYFGQGEAPFCAADLHPEARVGGG